MPGPPAPAGPSTPSLVLQHYRGRTRSVGAQVSRSTPPDPQGMPVEPLREPGPRLPAEPMREPGSAPSGMPAEFLEPPRIQGHEPLREPGRSEHPCDCRPSPCANRAPRLPECRPKPAGMPAAPRPPPAATPPGSMGGSFGGGVGLHVDLGSPPSSRASALPGSSGPNEDPMGGTVKRVVGQLRAHRLWRTNVLGGIGWSSIRT